MNKQIEIQKRKKRREKRTRSKLFGTKEHPRLSVFRSNKYIYAQIINDQDGKTLLSVSIKDLDFKKNDKKTKVEEAFLLGRLLAKKTLEEKIKSVQFDKGSYKYHGRVKSLAEGARQGGLIF